MNINLLVGIAQCRVLDCDFKGYRCKSYYLPILKKIFSKTNILLNYTPTLELHNTPVTQINFYISALWDAATPLLRTTCISVTKRSRMRLHILKIFTKNTNLNKLYMFCNNLIFFSPGIILRFIKAKDQRSLKKRIKVWYGFVKASIVVFKNPLIVWFDSLVGKKALFLNKFVRSGLTISWVFFKMFYLTYNLNTKKKRRIKRWVKKKYFRLSHNEHN